MNALLASATLAATPLLLAALGGLVNRQGGLVNIALEGKMLLGAIVGVIVSAVLHSWVAGMLAAGAAGAVAGLVFSVIVTRLGANEIIAGLGLNILIAGAIGYGLGDRGTYQPAGLETVPRIHLPLIDDIPVLGGILSDKDPVTYLTWLAIPALAWVLLNTSAGLRLRAAGDPGDTAHALGLATLRIRDASTVVAGAFAGLAGAELALALVGLFNKGMVAGRGYIALAAFYFGRARPWPTALACLLFAFFDGLQIRLQQSGVSTELVGTLPYLVVVVVLTLTALSELRRGREVTT